MDDGNSTTTRLLTLLNMSATKAGKRKRTEEFIPSQKLNKRKSTVRFSVSGPEVSSENKQTAVLQEAPVLEITNMPELQDKDDFGSENISDAYERHFGVKPTTLSETSRAAVDRRAWKSSRIKHGKLGTILVSTPEGLEENVAVHTGAHEIDILERLKTPFQSRQSRHPRDQIELQNDLLSILSSHRDLYLTSTPWEHKKNLREALTLHALNHVTKKRRRVLKNNERLAHALKFNPNNPPPEDVQDQGFTRPSVLIILPFRSSAFDWFNSLTSHTPSPTYQIENHARFVAEYSLPPGTVDKLTTADPGTYPRDHIETFKGNIDDEFRLGIKITRKSVKVFAEFYGCDIILASPLGLRRSIEKESNADFLSSIEILVVDEMDTLVMQNWEHVLFVFSNLNKPPKESHNADFSRIKPWYLDGHAAYLRQSILLSAFETPESRSLYNNTLKNVAGKIRTEKRWPPIQVPEGINQNFIQFDCANAKDEVDKRFDHFTTQILPTVVKSAVQSVNTVIFIPSSFDFIRVHNYFKKHAGVTFAVLSEYSTNQDISRARQSFFAGKRSFLLMSERFHFYRRYKIRGIRNFLFYGPPDHPQFYTELLSYPFLDEGVEASDVTCRVLYSKYDWFRLERIAGTDSATDLIRFR